VDFVKLASPPLSTGIVGAANKGYVAQLHPKVASPSWISRMAACARSPLRAGSEGRAVKELEGSNMRKSLFALFCVGALTSCGSRPDSWTPG